MKTYTITCLGIGLLLLSAASWASAQSASDIEQLMRAKFEKAAAPGLDGRVGVTINSIKIGRTDPANEQDVINGIPPAAQVVSALVDFTRTTYYRTATEMNRRVQEMKIYKDKFEELALMPGPTRGSDQISRGPAQ
jgi:hypothetical protein